MTDLEALLSHDLDSFLKGRELVDAPRDRFSEIDKVAWRKSRADMAVASAFKALQMSNHYRAKAIATQIAADKTSDQASERFKIERARADAAEAKLADIMERMKE